MKSKLPLKVFYCDAETTGLDKKIHEAVQFGCIVEVDGQVVDELEIKLRPSKLKSISPEALRVQKRSLQDLLNFPPRKDSYAKLLAFLNKHVNTRVVGDKFFWTGQNPEFDRGFMEELFREFNNATFQSYFDRRSADLIALALAMRQKGLFNPRSFGLEAMAEELGITYDAHDAMNDIRVTRQIWTTFLGWINGPHRFPKQLTLI